MDNILIRFPCENEQKAIVQKVEIMEKCRALEAEITQSEQYSHAYADGIERGF